MTAKQLKLLSDEVINHLAAAIMQLPEEWRKAVAGEANRRAAKRRVAGEFAS